GWGWVRGQNCRILWVGSSVGRAAPKGFGVGVGFEGRIAEFYGLVAQSVEQRPFKPLVLGSSPSQPTTFSYGLGLHALRRIRSLLYWFYGVSRSTDGTAPQRPHAHNQAIGRRP